jgi:thiamine pyrophosphate-dependent acetolactate synthase large subunit-like protein
MGLPMAVGLGLALAHQHKTIVVLTGDGNFLMGLGSITTISYLSPPNLKIIILDNEAYATTGGQETVSAIINYPSMIRGMGITAVKSIDPHETPSNLDKLLEKTIRKSGLKILHIKIEKEIIPLDYIPWHPVRICLNFMKQHNINSKTEEKKMRDNEFNP